MILTRDHLQTTESMRFVVEVANRHPPCNKTITHMAEEITFCSWSMPTGRILKDGLCSCPQRTETIP